MLSFNTEQRDLSVTLIDPHADQTGQIPHFLILSSLAVDDRYTVDAEDAKQWVCRVILRRRDTCRRPLQFLSRTIHARTKGDKSLCI